MAFLILISEETPREIFQLGRATLMIGRDEDSEIRVDDHSVSRNHASIVFDGKDYVVRDNGSTNGTYVNGERVSHHVLRQHDILRFGSCMFLVDLSGPKRGPKGTEVMDVTHVGTRKGRAFDLKSKPLIPGSPVKPVRLILSTAPSVKKSKPEEEPPPPVTAR